jgi:serine phosphatase RsbU (regulator of sigma subunit)
MAGKLPFLSLGSVRAKFLAFVSIMHDITERKRTEEQLAEKEAHLRLVFDNMPGEIVYTDKELNIVLCTDRFADSYHAPRELLQPGRPYPQFLRYLAEHGYYGEGDPDAFVAERVESLRNPSDKTSETRTPDGHIYEIHRRRAATGGTVTVMSDITERKRLEGDLQEAYGIIKDQKERMEKELNVAHEIQMSMVPLTFPPFPERKEFTIYATLEPALEVGGDFYDFFFIDEDRLCFCVGDVSGKGVPAALFMAVTRTMIKSKASADPSTASILTFVNEQISQENPNCMFVTLWVGVLDIRTGEVTYTNAGHNPPYLKRVDGSLEKLDMLHGPVVGAVEGLVYGEDKLKFSSEDLLLAFTDGVTEEIDVNDELYGDMRLETLLSEMTDVSVERSVQDVVASVREFQGESAQDDDITVLALQFHA